MALRHTGDNPHLNQWRIYASLVLNESITSPNISKKLMDDYCRITRIYCWCIAIAGNWNRKRFMCNWQSLFHCHSGIHLKTNKIANKCHLILPEAHLMCYSSLFGSVMSTIKLMDPFLQRLTEIMAWMSNHNHGFNDLSITIYYSSLISDARGRSGSGLTMTLTNDVKVTPPLETLCITEISRHLVMDK